VLDKAIQLHPNTPSLAEDRVLVQCAQGDLTQNDLDKLIVLLRTARFDQSGLESIETLRAAATQGSCPALTSDAWLSITSALLSNPLYVNNRFATGYLHYQRHFWAVSQGDLNMAIHELEATYQNDPDANIPRLEAQYLASAHLYDQAVDVLSNTDYHRLPLLRRLLVDDRSINAADIAAISQMRKDERNARGETE